MYSCWYVLLMLLLSLALLQGLANFTLHMTSSTDLGHIVVSKIVFAKPNQEITNRLAIEIIDMNLRTSVIGSQTHDRWVLHKTAVLVMIDKPEVPRRGGCSSVGDADGTKLTAICVRTIERREPPLPRIDGDSRDSAHCSRYHRISVQPAAQHDRVQHLRDRHDASRGYQDGW